MEIQNIHQSAQVQGVEANAFGFEMNAKMYDILISKMYTNKPAAVIRELSANAWDAHVEAGKADTPFDLHLPSWLDKTFAIRDYGTGIPHDKFEHIYTNVGASTKEETNDLIGGFGLGSKTPFTMTDTFMVENFHGGIKTTWLCFKDKGEPQVTKVAEEESKESSGLRVSFSFDEGDVPEFTKQVPIQLRYFPVKPKITGGEGTVTFKKLPDGWETQDYFYTTNDDWRSKNFVVMGNVAYKLDSGEFDYSLRSIFNKGLTIKVPIGSVDIPPSREHLEMTPRTKKYITEVLHRIRREYVQGLQNQLDKCTTSFEARKVIYDANGSLINDYTVLTWNKEKVPWNVWRNGYIRSVAGLPLRTVQRRYANVYRSTGAQMRGVIDGTLKFYVMDLGIGFSQFINENHSAHDLSKVVIVHVPPAPKATYDDRVSQAIKDCEEELNVKPALLSSILGKPVPKPKAPPTPKDKNRSEPNQVFRVKDSNNIPEEGTLRYHMEEQTDIPTDGYYLEIHGAQIKTDLQIRVLLRSGLMHFLDKPLYFIRAKTIAKLGKGMEILTDDVLKSFIPDIIKIHKEQRNRRQLLSSMHRVNKLERSILPVLRDKSIAAYVRYASYILKQTTLHDDLDTDRLHRIIMKKALEYTPTLNPKVKKLKEKYEPIHRLVRQITSSWNKQSNQENIDTFVKLITENH
jgi:hypothetical protein